MILRVMNTVPQKKNRLIKRLRYLWTFELFDSLFLPAVALFSARRLEQVVGLLTLYGAGLVAWLLWQGAAYWWLKLRAVRRDSVVSAAHLRWFALLKRVNWILIGLLPVLVAVRSAVGLGVPSTFDGIAGLALYGLAVLEQINYYHYQLMYDYPPDWRWLVENRRLKRSSLSRALRAQDVGGATGA